LLVLLRKACMLSPPHDQTTAIDADSQSKPASMLAERATAIGFAFAVCVAMIGWLYVLALVLWNAASWLMS
jgi:hypothetical protein